MATIKSFTDISQSKTLSKILPLESADMYYWLAWSGGVPKEERNTPKVGIPNKNAIKTYWCPCWSLAVLFDVLPDGTDVIKDKSDTENEKYMCTVGVTSGIISIFGNNPVDTCYEMIVKLHELNLL